MEPQHKKFYEDIKAGIKDECDKIELKSNNVGGIIAPNPGIAGLNDIETDNSNGCFKLFTRPLGPPLTT